MTPLQSLSSLFLLFLFTSNVHSTSPIPPPVAPSTVQLPVAQIPNVPSIGIGKQASSVEAPLPSSPPVAERKSDYDLPLNPRETLKGSESQGYGSRYNNGAGGYNSAAPPPPPPSNYGPAVSVQHEDSYGGNSYESGSSNPQSSYQQQPANNNYQQPLSNNYNQAPAQSTYPAQQQSSYPAPQQSSYNTPQQDYNSKGQSYNGNLGAEKNYAANAAQVAQPQQPYASPAAPVKLAQNSYSSAPVPAPASNNNYGSSNSNYASSSPYSAGNNADNYGITESYAGDDGLYGSEEDDFADAYSPGDIGSYETDNYSPPPSPPTGKNPPTQSGYSGQSNSNNYPPAPAAQQQQQQSSYPSPPASVLQQNQQYQQPQQQTQENYDVKGTGNNYGGNNNNYPPAPAAQQPQQPQLNNYNTVSDTYSRGPSQQQQSSQYQTTQYTIPLSYGGFTPLGRGQSQQGYNNPVQQYPAQQNNQYPAQQQQQPYGQQQNNYPTPQPHQNNYPPQHQYPQQQQQQQPAQSQQQNYQSPQPYNNQKPIIAKPLVVTLVQSNSKGNDYQNGQIQSSYSTPQQSQAYPPPQQQNSYPSNAPQGNYPANNPQQQQPRHQYQQLPPNSYSGPALPLNSYQQNAPYAPPQSNSPPAQSQYQGPGSSSPSSHGSEGLSHSYDVSPDDDTDDDGEYTPSVSHGPSPPYHPQYPEVLSHHPDYHHSSGYRLPSSGPAYPLIPKAPTATSYSNAGFGLDYALGKPYGGRWLSKPYGRKFLRRRPKPHQYYGEDETASLDVSLPLEYGRPPASTPAPYGTPSTLTALSSGMSSYRNPSSFVPSFGSYGLASSVNVPSYSPALIPEFPEEQYSGSTYSLTPPKHYRGHTVLGSQKSKVVEAEKESPEEDSSTTAFTYKTAASRLIPRFVKSPFKSLFKVFSSRKQKSFLG